MATIVTFGEIMLRLSPPGKRRIAQAESFEASFGGAEANVAVSLAQLGHAARFVSRVPANPLGDAAVASLRARGVDVTRVHRGGARLGVYYLEHGASLRPSRVVYDRAHSAFSGIGAGETDWAAAFDGASWFHFTGITPALSAGCADATAEAVAEARGRGLRVSCDLNYRSALWTRERARELLTALTRGVDLLIANESDAFDVFGIRTEASDAEAGSIDAEAYGRTARELAGITGAAAVAITLRESRSASNNGWSGLLSPGGEVLHGRKVDLDIVDRVGAGDAFAAGLIHALLNGWPAQRCLDFAIAAGALKHTIPGDWNLASEAEVLAVVDGDVSGRVKR
jgi:2-dehydro-3-deoxygluconokinase